MKTTSDHFPKSPNGQAAATGRKIRSIIFSLAMSGALLAAGFSPAAAAGYYDAVFGADGYFARLAAAFGKRSAPAGDDAVLAVKTWTGGSSATMNAVGNWTPSIAVAGDDLVFPEAASNKAINNNFSAGTSFNSLTFNGTAYSLAGNSLTLANGLTTNIAATGAGPTIAQAITLSGPQTFNTVNRSLTLGGVLNVGTFGLTVDGAGNTTFGNNVNGSGAGIINKLGSGTLTLNGGGTLPTLNAGGGILSVNGTAGQVALNGGTLAGSGTVTGVTSGSGGVSPGNGISGTGILTSTGNIVTNTNVTVTIDLNGPTAGTQHDRLVANGSIVLGGANLNIISTFTPTPGQTFTIAQAGIGVSGQFAQGGAVVANGQIYSITYNPTSVVLTALGSSSLSWDGGGTTNNWSDANNWNPNIAPADGAELVFAAGAARRTNVNDITGLDIGSIEIDDSYTITGNAIGLNTGITVLQNGSATSFGLPITLLQAQEFKNISATATNFSLGGTVDIGSFQLTLTSTAGNLVNITGAISGTGNIVKSGAGNVQIGGTNTYSGSTAVNAGTLTVTNDNGLGATSAGTTVASGATLSLANITLAEPLTVSGGTLRTSSTFLTPNVNGAVSFNAPSTIDVSDNATMTFNGLFNAVVNSALTKTGNGTLKVTGTSSVFASPTVVGAGALEVTGAMDLNQITVSAGAALRGTGSVGTVILDGGTVNPGVGPNGTGTLTVATFFIHPNSTFNVNINGAAAGQFDRINVQQGFQLNGLRLTGTLGFVPTPGQQFQIFGSPSALGGQLATGTSAVVGGWRFNAAYPSNGITLTAAARLGPPPADFDGDRKSDISIFRPSDGSWWYSRSSDNLVPVFSFGTGTDVPVPGDWTGDGKTDIAVWRPSNGSWFVQRSEDGSFFSFPFGANGDVPAPADFDGDGKADAGVFRASTGTWFISNSGGGGTSIVSFGAAGDKPVPADFDGDGKADIAIFRPSDGSWWYIRSIDGQFRVFTFGTASDKPVPGDYTGDGRADIAIWRPATGTWFVMRSDDNSFFSVPFGTASDLPAPGDYDGDGKFDFAVFRPASGDWFVQRSTAGLLIANFGANGDRPVPGVFVP